MSRLHRLLLASAAAVLAGCGNGTVIGGGASPTASPSVPNVSYEYTVPTAAANPATVVTAGDGFLYFTEQAASKIGKLSTGGVFTEISTVTPAAGPFSIIVGPDGNLWWTQTNAGSIATVSTAFSATAIAQYALWSGAHPNFISRGVPLNTMYFTDTGTNAIGAITTAGAASGPFTIPTANANPQGIAVGPDNKMWFTENNTAKIGVLDPNTNTIAEYALPAGSHPWGIAQGPDGAMWFTENIPGAPKLGRMTTSHQYSDFTLTGAASALGLTTDLYGNLVVTDATNSAIGVFSPTSQKFTEYTTKTGSASPSWITIGPDGRLYFTEPAADKIGQFSYF